MRSTLCVIGATLVLSAAAFADQPDCRKVNGKLSEFVMSPFNSPNDPFGRNVFVSLGTINGIGSSVLTTVGPGPIQGTLAVTTLHTFVVSGEDQINALGSAVFTPIPGTSNVAEVLTLTVTGGTGKFAAATGV